MEGGDKLVTFPMPLGEAKLVTEILEFAIGISGTIAKHSHLFTEKGLSMMEIKGRLDEEIKK